MKTVLPPISTKSLTVADVEELTRTTREAMLAALISLTESPMGQKATLPVVTAKKDNRAPVAMAIGSGVRH